MGDQSIFKSRANQWARGIIDVLETEYPAAMHHVNDSADDVLVIPNQLHPSFEVLPISWTEKSVSD